MVLIWGLAFGLALFTSEAAAKGVDRLGVGAKAGLLYGCLNGSGISLWGPVTKKVSWELGYTYGRTEKSDNLKEGDSTGLSDIDESEFADIEIEKASIRRNMLHAQIRMFPWANSFNIALGLAAARVEAEFRASSLTTAAYADESYIVDYAAMSYSFGNLWVRNNVFFGVDWIGSMSSFGPNVQHQVNSSDESNAALADYSARFQNSALYCSTHGGPILLVFNFGLFL